MTLRPLLLLPLLVSLAFADDYDFPGLKQVMTPSEWAHSGLDQLSPDQVSIIDSALTRHYAHTVDAAAAAATARAVKAAQDRAAVLAAENKGNWWQHFGMTENSPGWHDRTALKAQVLDWAGGNQFRLDNGQVWEGLRPIPYELKGKHIEIQPRPNGEFDLSVEGRDANILVRRLQ